MRASHEQRAASSEPRLSVQKLWCNYVCGCKQKPLHLRARGQGHGELRAATSKPLQFVQEQLWCNYALKQGHVAACGWLPLHVCSTCWQEQAGTGCEPGARAALMSIYGEGSPMAVGAPAPVAVRAASCELRAAKLETPGLVQEPPLFEVCHASKALWLRAMAPAHLPSGGCDAKAGTQCKHWYAQLLLAFALELAHVLVIP